MSRKLTFGLAGLVALIAAGGAFWYFFIRDDSPPPVSLDSALGSLTTPTQGTSSTPVPGETPVPTPTSEPEANPSAVDGSWELDPTANNFVGYRVQEELAGVGATTAVGRTSKVTGSLVIDGGAVQPGAAFVADMTSLRSDSSLRDSQLRNQGIEFSRFPTSTFTLTQAIDVPEGFADGERFSTTLVGNFELHGVVRQVEIPVEAQIANEVLVVVGSITIQFPDYDITAPSAARVLSIENEGIMEFQLFFRRA